MVRVRKAKKPKGKVWPDLRTSRSGSWTHCMRSTWKASNLRKKRWLTNLSKTKRRRKLLREKHQGRNARWRLRRGIYFWKVCRIRSSVEMATKCSGSKRTTFFWYTTLWYSSGTTKLPISTSSRYWWLASWCQSTSVVLFMNQSSKYRQLLRKTTRTSPKRMKWTSSLGNVEQTRSMRHQSLSAFTRDGSKSTSFSVQLMQQSFSKRTIFFLWCKLVTWNWQRVSTRRLKRKLRSYKT